MLEPHDLRGMVALAAKSLGSCDILVNSAGIQFVSPVEDFPDEKWDAILRINLGAPFQAIKAAVPLMKRRGWGGNVRGKSRCR
jgi:3-hydroxybutyrate dehydrogenase